MTFVGVLDMIGKDFAKGLKWAVTYSVPVERLVALLFPTAAPVALEVADATALIQSAVLLVEQKYAASGVQSGTGQQKLAEVLLLAGDAVSALLSKAGINGSTEYVSRLISAVVAILNAQQASLERVSAREAELEEKLAEAQQTIAVLKASAGRKTSAAGSFAAKEGSSVEAGSLDAALGSLSIEQRIAVKSGLMRSGLLG